MRPGVEGGGEDEGRVGDVEKDRAGVREGDRVGVESRDSVIEGVKVGDVEGEDEDTSGRPAVSLWSLVDSSSLILSVEASISPSCTSSSLPPNRLNSYLFLGVIPFVLPSSDDSVFVFSNNLASPSSLEGLRVGSTNSSFPLSS